MGPEGPWGQKLVVWLWAWLSYSQDEVDLTKSVRDLGLVAKSTFAQLLTSKCSIGCAGFRNSGPGILVMRTVQALGSGVLRWLHSFSGSWPEQMNMSQNGFCDLCESSDLESIILSVTGYIGAFLCKPSFRLGGSSKQKCSLESCFGQNSAKAL